MLGAKLKLIFSRVSPSSGNVFNSRFASQRGKPFASFHSSLRRGQAFTTSTKKSSEKQESIFARALNWYSSMLDHSPLLTKSISGGIIAGTGDFLCQLLLERPESIHLKDEEKDAVPESFFVNWDHERSTRFFVLGTFFVAPTSHYWYDLLEKYVGSGKNVVLVGKRVFLDQFIWTPVFFIIWLVGLWTMEGTPIESLPKRLSEKYRDIMIANWIVWIPAQAANFYFIPVKYQVLYQNLVELLWNVYLSFSATGKGENNHSKTKVKEPSAQNGENKD